MRGKRVKFSKSYNYAIFLKTNFSFLACKYLLLKSCKSLRLDNKIHFGLLLLTLGNAIDSSLFLVDFECDNNSK